MKSWRGLFLRVLFALIFGAVLLDLGLRVLSRTEGEHLTLFGLKLLPFERLTVAHAAVLERAPAAADYIVPDAHLGWTIRPNGRSTDGLFQSDARGLRCGAAAPPETLGAAALLLSGDSFTHGDELPWESTWSAQLQQQLGVAHRVHNAGVPGYGTDQALLRAEALLPELRPKQVVMALCRDDLLRNVNIVRAFYLHWTDFPWTKPRFVLRDGVLDLVNQPTVPVADVAAVVRGFEASSLVAFDDCFRPGFYAEPWTDSFRLLRFLRSRREHRERHEHLLHLVSEGGEAVQTTAAILERFAHSARAQGAQPLVLLLPQADDLPRYKSGTASVFAPLLRLLQAAQVPCRDLGPTLLASLQPGEECSALFVNGSGHPNERAAALIAASVAAWVREQH